MKQTFTASLQREGNWVIAQCLEVDVASQGETPDEALANLAEALTLHFLPPVSTVLTEVRSIEVDIGAA
jgi:hypothetical protein